MTNEDKKEILKAYYYKYEKDLIARIFEITENEIDKILEEGEDFLKELGERTYD